MMENVKVRSPDQVGPRWVPRLRDADARIERRRARDSPPYRANRI